MAIITLLTDFGQQEPFVGVMKGVMLTLADPSTRIVDLSHDIPPQDVRSAAFWLAQSYKYFPPGTIHVCVVDPGVGSSRRILVAHSPTQCLLAPDNGVLTHVLAADELVVRQVDAFERAEPGTTFDGRDVFAPLAARLACGEGPEDLGPVVQDWEALRVPIPREKEGHVAGEVEVIDRFGNLITNIEATRRARRVSIFDQSIPWVSCYSDVPTGQLMALRNAWGRVEIALRDGSARHALGCPVGSRVAVEFDDSLKPPA